MDKQSVISGSAGHFLFCETWYFYSDEDSGRGLLDCDAV